VQLAVGQVAIGGTRCASAFKMQRIPELHFSASVGEEPKVEVAMAITELYARSQSP
jgi:hypothetical protein